MKFNDHNFLSALLTVIVFGTFVYIPSCVLSKTEYVEFIECSEEPIKGRVLILKVFHDEVIYSLFFYIGG